MRRSLQALALGLVVGAAGVAALRPGFGLEADLGLRLLYALRGPIEPPADVVVVAIDELSASALGLPPKPRDWPRSLHAEVVRYLARAGVRVIVFDLTFDTASTVPAHDEALADAIGAAGNVVLTETLREDTFELTVADGGLLGMASLEGSLAPLPRLREAARATGPVVLPKDVRVDAYWAFRRDGGDAPTLPVLAFHLHAAEAFDALRRQLGIESTDLLAAVRETHDALQDAARARAAEAALLPPGADARGRRLARSLLHLHLGGELRALNYYGPPRTIATVPYLHVLQAARQTPGAPDALGLAGKTVFIGYSPGTPGAQERLRDAYRTHFSQPNGLDSSGVEIAATAFANLVEDRPLRTLPPLGPLALVLGAAALWATLATGRRPVVALAAMALPALVYAGVAGALFVQAAWWLPVVAPLGVQLPLALFGGAVIGYRRTHRERRAVEHALRQFLPSSVVDQLARRIVSVTSGNRVVFGICLASDAASYTTLAESHGPAQLGALMNAYFAELFRPVKRSGGIVVDVVGDSMVAVWADAASPSPALRRSACLAALDIVAATRRAPDGAPPAAQLPTRIGLHAGDMLLGSVGALGHFEYRAIGDVINTASRVEGLNKLLGTELLATAEVVEGLSDFETRPLGSFLLQGKRSPIDVVEVRGLRGAEPGPDHSLCSEFAAALACRRERRWGDAVAAFERLAERQGADGPTRFYLAECARLAASPPGPAWSPTIQVATK